jgi:hypothetical protein
VAVWGAACFAGLVGKDCDGGFVWYAEGKHIAAGESDYSQNDRDGLEACSPRCGPIPRTTPASSHAYLRACAR